MVGAISSANCWVLNSAIDQPTPQPNMTMAAALITVLVAVMRFMGVPQGLLHQPTIIPRFGFVGGWTFIRGWRGKISLASPADGHGLDTFVWAQRTQRTV